MLENNYLTNCLIVPPALTQHTYTHTDEHVTNNPLHKQYVAGVQQQQNAGNVIVLTPRIQLDCPSYIPTLQIYVHEKMCTYMNSFITVITARSATLIRIKRWLIENVWTEVLHSSSRTLSSNHT